MQLDRLCENITFAIGHTGVVKNIHFLSFTSFDYTCDCVSGFGGSECHLPGCGGTLTSQESLQDLLIPDVTDHEIGCIWTIESPPDSAVNVFIRDINRGFCAPGDITVWSGMLHIIHKS